jgi:hypothetical protein
MNANLKRVLAALKTHGLLMMTDVCLPSIAGLVAGAPVRGSWWAHPESHAIYAVVVALDDHADVLVTKLISSKVTFVARSLWPAVLALASSRESWQMQGLSREARSLLAEVDRQGEMRGDGIASLVIRELENVLLVHSEEFHSETGAHKKKLQTWANWAKEAGFSSPAMPAEQAQAILEQAVAGLNRQYQGKGRLPWQVAIRRAKKSRPL